MSDTADRVRRLITEHLQAEIASDDANLFDLGADSLDAVEIVMSLEEEFGITISDEDMENAATVGDVIKLVETKT